ncbi:MAG TPA: tRNA epoxyqueuosine(34) reductase QueG [Sedimentisphaerales bacterium]|nr:tRNA epoxyqueuosine(34) reductase QueG [Sedimentisphaerales bacterium]
MGLAEDIKAKALEFGFDAAGITDAGPIDDEQFKMLADWVAFGYAGRMNYMRENLDKRANPAKLLKSARSVICVGLNYTPLSDRGTRDERRRTRDETGHLPSSSPMGRVANYAQYEDYHSFIKRQLRNLVDFISSVADGEHEFKICVDSVPLAERSLAVRAGLGFIGKSHILINRKLGPQIFLGEIVTSLKLQTDEPIADSCHSCNKCIEACPTGALRADGQFDANKCISYLTIEYSQGGRLSAKGQVPTGLAEKVGDWLFGCDECVLACPYQEEAPVCKNRQFKFYSDRANLDLGRILDLTEEDFEAEFAGSAIKRLGLDRLKRNARICLSNITRHSI